MRTRRWIAGLLALAVASGCTASDDTSDDTSDEGGDSGTPAAVTGVTDDTVRLGVAGVDPQQVADLGLEADFVPPEALYQAWVDTQNEAGGVAGRQIELVFEPFLPLGDTEAEAACVALTEDEQVFLVTGILTGDTPLCFTEAHATPYLGQYGHSAERDERSKAPFVALEMADERQRLAGLQVFLDEGALDGRVALYWGAADTATVEEYVKPALDEAGVEVVVETALDDFGGDQAAEDQALDTIVERIRAAEPDAVLNVSDFLQPLVAFQRNGWLPDQVLSTSAQALVGGVLADSGLDAETLARVTVAAPYAPTKEELLADPEVQRCVDEYNATQPEEPIDMAASTVDTLDALANDCAAFRLFVLATEAAGDDLTPESWGRGAESLGELELPGMPFASLSADKHSAGDAIGHYRYDAAAGRMVATEPPIEAPA